MKTKAHELESGTWSDDRSKYFCDNLPSGLRHTGHADEVYQYIEHRGWFTDNFMDEVLRGFVLQLPTNKGQLRYIPATTHSDWDGVTLYMSDICDDPEEAARSADRYAQIEAEVAREDDAKFQAEVQIENLHEEMQDAIAQFRRVKVAAQIDQLSGPICELVQAELRNLRYSVHEAAQKINSLKSNPWESVQ